MVKGGQNVMVDVIGGALDSPSHFIVFSFTILDGSTCYIRQFCITLWISSQNYNVITFMHHH
jgi:hypothetical protein